MGVHLRMLCSDAAKFNAPPLDCAAFTNERVLQTSLTGIDGRCTRDLNARTVLLIRFRPAWLGIIGLVLLSFLFLFVSIAHAQETTVPCNTSAPSNRLPQVQLLAVAAGFTQPVHLAVAPDHPDRLFIVEQPGTVRIVENGAVRPEPFLDLKKQVRSGGERGLLSIAFHPRYRENGLFYVNYTGGSWQLTSRISEFARRDAWSARADKERLLIEIQQPYSNHNGGQIAFGADGMLYIGMGDGGSANDPHGHGQNLATLLGSMLRIDVTPGDSAAYRIPPDNPFVKRAGARAEAWAYGFRNPWRFSFDALTGELWAADVGQNAREEIDIVRAGLNYGWNIMEGDICTPSVNAKCDTRHFEKPVFSYGRGDGMAITGGFVYRGRAIPELCGKYIYADYVTQRIWALTRSPNGSVDNALLMQAPDNISSFGVDGHHELYVLGHNSGNVWRIGKPPS